MRDSEDIICGRNSVIEAIRRGNTVDKVLIADGKKDGAVNTVIREAKRNKIIIEFTDKKVLDGMCDESKHQGVVAYISPYEYVDVEVILRIARDKGEDPFIILLDEIEDPHNLGAIIRTANMCGAHGVVIPKRRAARLTSVVAKTSAGAINYTPVAKVTNISKTIEELKKLGLWFVCGDMSGQSMYSLDLTGPIGLVIGNEGSGVSPKIMKKCDFIAAIPTFGDIDSLNASVSCGVLSYEIIRQRINKKS